MKTIILLSLFGFLVLGCGEKKQTENDSLNILKVKIDSLQSLNDSLVKKTIKDTLSINWYEPIYGGRNLLNRGIENPVAFIVQSLKNKPELIPIKGVLGGTMHFTEIKPLNSKWVIAYYEDGHIGGEAIYKYRLNDKGELEFELLDLIEP